MITGRRRRCPSCHSVDVVPILYGAVDEDAQAAANARLVHLGGRERVPDPPEWHCNGCGYQWARLADPS